MAVCEISYGGISMQDCLKMTFDRFTDIVEKTNEISKRNESELQKMKNPGE